MKPTPMMALPFATLMMLISSTFLRLPGSAATEVVNHYETIPSDTVSIDDQPQSSRHIKDFNQEDSLLTSSDIPWTALTLEVLNKWDAYGDLDTVRMHNIQIKDSLKQPDTELTVIEKIARSKHIARR